MTLRIYDDGSYMNIPETQETQQEIKEEEGQEENKGEKPEKLDKKWRNPDGTMKPGHPNIGGRPKGSTLKEYQAERFRQMTDEEKEKWITDHNISGIDLWKMSEGQPHQTSDMGVEIKPTPLLDALRGHTDDKKEEE